MYAVRLALTALWWRRSLSAMILLVAAVASSTAVVGPLYGRSAEESLLRDQLTAKGPAVSSFAAGITFNTGSVPTKTLLANVTARAQNPALDPWYGPVQQSVSVPETVLTRATFGTFARARVQWRASACAALVLESGTCPTGAHQAMVSQLAAAAFKLQLGDRFDLGISSPDGPVQVVGIYQRGDGSAPVWGGVNPFDAAPSRNDGVDRMDSVFVDQATMMSAVDDTWRADAFRLMIVDRVRLDDLDPIIAATRAGGVTDPSAQIFAPFPGFVDDLASDRSAVRLAAIVVTSQLVLLAWYVLFLIVASSTEERAAEVALAKLRGMTAGAATVFGLAEAVLLLTLAIPLGLLIGIGLDRLLVARILLPGTPVSVQWPAVAALLLSFFGGVIACVIAARRTLAAPVLDQLRRASSRRTAGLRATAIDGIVLTLAAAGLYELSRGGSDSLTLFTPGLLAFAVGLIGIRFLPLVARLAELRTRQSPRVSSYLAIRQIARRPAGLRIVVLLTVAMALAVFSVDCWYVASGNRALAARATIGSTEVLHVQATSTAALLNAVRAADPKGSEAMAVVQVRGTDGSGDLLAVDAQRLAAVSAWDPSWSAASATELGALLHPVTAPSVLVRDRVTLVLNTTALTAPVPITVAAELRDNGNRTLHVPLGLLVKGQSTLSAPIPECTADCRLVAIGFDRPLVTTESTKGAVTVTAISDGRGPVAAGLTAGASWRPQRASITDATAPVPTTVAPAADGLHVTFATDASEPARVEVADFPEAVPLLSPASGSLTQFGNTPGIAYAAGVDDSQILVRPVSAASWIPRAGRTGLLVDLEYALRAAPRQPQRPDLQVWLSPTASPQIEQRLQATGVSVNTRESTASQLSLLDRDGTALALRLFIAAALAALVLAVIAVVTSVFVGARRREFELAAMRSFGTPRRTLLRAGRSELLVLLLVGTGLGGATGLVAARAVLPTVPSLGTGLGGPDPTFAVVWPPLLILSAVVLVTIVVLAHLAARLIVDAAAPERLREVQA